MVSKDTNDIITFWQLKEATVREVQYKYRSDSETQNSLLQAVKKKPQYSRMMRMLYCLLYVKRHCHYFLLISAYCLNMSS